MLKATRGVHLPYASRARTLAVYVPGPLSPGFSSQLTRQFRRHE